LRLGPNRAKITSIWREKVEVIKDNEKSEPEKKK
jgi:hypothetical protein